MDSDGVLRRQVCDACAHCQGRVLRAASGHSPQAEGKGGRCVLCEVPRSSVALPECGDSDAVAARPLGHYPLLHPHTPPAFPSAPCFCIILVLMCVFSLCPDQALRGCVALHCRVVECSTSVITSHKALSQIPATIPSKSRRRSAGAVTAPARGHSASTRSSGQRHLIRVRCGGTDGIGSCEMGRTPDFRRPLTPAASGGLRGPGGGWFGYGARTTERT